MDETDAKKIFEEIQNLKKEHEKLKEENEQLKRLLKENSIIVPSEVVPQYSERKQMLKVTNLDETQSEVAESINLNLRDEFYIEDSKIDNSDWTEPHNNNPKTNDEETEPNELNAPDLDSNHSNENNFYFEKCELDPDSIMKRKANRTPPKSQSPSAPTTEVIEDNKIPSYKVSHQKFTDKEKKLEEIHEPLTPTQKKRKKILQDLLGEHHIEPNINKNSEFDEYDGSDLKMNYKKSVKLNKPNYNVNKSVKDFDELDDDVSNDSLELDSIMHKKVQRTPVSTSKYENYENNIQLSTPANTRKEIIDNSLVTYKEEKDDMSIISFLARSDKRVQILKSLVDSDKIPSIISKEIGDSNHHVSKYLKNLKEKGLVVCLNENDKRFRFYSITPKGKKYLKIMEDKNY